jgi:hypothetical protein
MRKILLPLSDRSGSPCLPGRTDVLRALPHRLRLQDFGLKRFRHAKKSPIPPISDRRLVTNAQRPTISDQRPRLNYHRFPVLSKHTAHGVGNFTHGRVRLHGRQNTRHHIFSRARRILDRLER